MQQGVASSQEDMSASPLGQKLTKAGLNADDTLNNLPGPTPSPDPNFNASVITESGSIPPMDVVADRAIRSVVLAAKQNRELLNGPIGAQASDPNKGFPNGYSPWML